jgi:hypothetical protein
MVDSVPGYNFWWCYSTRGLYINCSSRSRGKHKKAFSTFSNIESHIETFPIMQWRVLEAVKPAWRAQCSHAHQSTGWKEQPFTFTASRSTTGWSFYQSSTHFEICLFGRHLNGKADASTAIVNNTACPHSWVPMYWPSLHFGTCHQPVHSEQRGKVGGGADIGKILYRGP